jgi:hypothetical protein
MSDKRILIVPAELVKKIDDNRGDLSQADFLDLMIESHLHKDEGKAVGGPGREELDALRRDLKDLTLREKKLATKEELQAFHEDTKKLLKSFVDFFVGYGLELGEKSPGLDLKDLTSKLNALDREHPAEEEGREVKIKWK